MTIKLVVLTADCRTKVITSEVIEVDTSANVFYTDINSGRLYPKSSLGGVFIEDGCLQLAVQEQLKDDAEVILKTLFEPKTKPVAGIGHGKGIGSYFK